MKIKNALIWTKEHGFLRGGLAFDSAVRSLEFDGIEDGHTFRPLELDGAEDALDAQGKYLLPGFVDVHVHGALGCDFSDADPAGADAIARRLVRHGVTSHLATTMTMPESALVSAARQTDFGANDPARSGCLGIHLEGPFLSYRKRGAQFAEYLHKADMDMFHRINDACGGMVKLIAVAPETDGAMEFIERASRETTVSLAHTTADYDTAMEAFRRGANHATHLFNGMEAMLHRAPGVVGAAMDAGAYVELICDGLHVHPAVIRAAFRMFPGRVVLISDAVRSAGMPDGDYTLGGQAITMKNGRTTLGDGTLAGSNITLLEALQNCVSFGIPLTEAVEAATLRPAVSVGIEGEVGSIEPGKRADFVLLDQDLNLCAVYHYGVEVRLDA